MFPVGLRWTEHQQQTLLYILLNCCLVLPPSRALVSTTTRPAVDSSRAIVVAPLTKLKALWKEKKKLAKILNQRHRLWSVGNIAEESVLLAAAILQTEGEKNKSQVHLVLRIPLVPKVLDMASLVDASSLLLLHSL